MEHEQARLILLGLATNATREDEYPEEWPCPTLRLLASGHLHAPGFEPEWMETT